MDNYCISGNIGSGKSLLCRQIVSRNIFGYKSPIVWIEIDEVVRFWHSQNKIKNSLYRAWKKNGVVCVKGSKKISKNRILFFSNYQQKYRAWSTLELLFHRLITLFITETIGKTKKQKGTLLWDMALEQLFPKNINVQHIKIIPKKKYETCFLLKKYRGITFRNSLFFMEKQKIN